MAYVLGLNLDTFLAALLTGHGVFLAVPFSATRLFRFSPRVERLPEAESWVEKIQRQDGGHDDRALKADEVLLSLDQVPTPALAQLSDPIHASHEDA